LALSVLIIEIIITGLTRSGGYPTKVYSILSIISDIAIYLGMLALDIWGIVTIVKNPQCNTSGW
jgi:hypothetical protein